MYNAAVVCDEVASEAAALCSVGGHLQHHQWWHAHEEHVLNTLCTQSALDRPHNVLLCISKNIGIYVYLHTNMYV